MNTYDQLLRNMLYIRISNHTPIAFLQIVLSIVSCDFDYANQYDAMLLSKI
jgi:hypothetical protein